MRRYVEQGYRTEALYDSRCRRRDAYDGYARIAGSMLGGIEEIVSPSKPKARKRACPRDDSEEKREEKSVRIRGAASEITHPFGTGHRQRAENSGEWQMCCVRLF